MSSGGPLYISNVSPHLPLQHPAEVSSPVAVNIFQGSFYLTALTGAVNSWRVQMRFEHGVVPPGDPVVHVVLLGHSRPSETRIWGGDHV